MTELFEYAQEITQSDLEQLEEYLDELWSALGIDIEFTRHFIERANDRRNGRQIKVKELTQIFRDCYHQWGKKIAQMGPEARGVLQDMRTHINLPFKLEWDREKQHLDLVAKTVMRKKDFRSHDHSFRVENNKNSSDDYRTIFEKEKKKDDEEERGDPSHDIKLSDFDPTVWPIIKKAMIDNPTARNELDALVKLVQKVMNRNDTDIDRLDDENKDQFSSIDTLDTNLAQDEKFMKANARVLRQLVSRIGELEKQVTKPAPPPEPEVTPPSQSPFESKYSFLRADSKKKFTRKALKS